MRLIYLHVDPTYMLILSFSLHAESFTCLIIYMFNLSNFLSTYPPIDLSIYLSMFEPTYLSTYLPTYLSVYLSIQLASQLSTYVPIIYLSTYVPIIYLSTYVPIIFLSTYVSPYLSIYPSTYLSIHLSIYLAGPPQTYHFICFKLSGGTNGGCHPA